MKTQERQAVILRYLQHRDFVYVSELMSVMKVSGATIRRDLNALEAQGKIIREYGKVVSRSEPAAMSEDFELGVQKKIIRCREEKRKIALYARQYVKDGDCLFLDSGTTPMLLYDFLRDLKITIVTNNLLLIEQVKPRDKARLIFSGGEFDPQHCTTTGVVYQNLVEQFQFDLCFIGVSGINLVRKQCTCTSLEAASVKKHAMANSRRSYVVADADKCHESGIICFAQFDEFDAIITNPMIQNVPEPIIFCE